MNKPLPVQLDPISWVIRISAVAMLGHLILSWPLWSGQGRSFPLIPLWGEAGTTEVVPGVILAVCSVVVLAGLLWKPLARPAILTALVWFGALVFLDLNRLQPWLYYYAVLWGCSLLPSRDAANGQRLLIAAVYVWGGVWKFSPYFVTENFPWFCEAFSWTKAFGQYPALGYMLAATEAVMGLGLMWTRTRKLFLGCSLAFHSFIVLALSPLGLHWNAVVIPWNLAMMAQVWVLFRSNTQTHPPHSIPAFALLAWVWLAPLLAETGTAPLCMAWTMYSNTQPEWNLYVDRGLVCAAMQPIWSTHAYDRKSKLLLDDWAMANLKVPAVNSAFAMRKLSRYWCHCVEEQYDGGMLRLTVAPFKKESIQIDTFPCVR